MNVYYPRMTSPSQDRLESLRRMQAVRRKYGEDMITFRDNDKEYELAKARFWAADAVIMAFLGMEE